MPLHLGYGNLTISRDYRVYESGHDKLNDTVASDPIAYKPFPEYNTPALH
jgi:hypothetical protein